MSLNYKMNGRFWLTPPQIYKELDREFQFDFDPCPFPRLENYNSLEVPWGKSNYVNPPFNLKDGPYGGPTAFARKAIDENQRGNGSVLVLPVRNYVNLLLKAGAEARPMGRIRWLECETGKEWKSPSPICAFILKGHSPKDE